MSAAHGRTGTSRREAEDRISPVLERIAAVRIVPVVTVPGPGSAVPLVTALAAGGLDVVELTLRTPDALDGLRLAAQVDGVLVGAGTVMTAGQAVAAADAGAQFVVSPGLHVEVVHACQDLGVLVVPGVGTATEYMAARRLGLDVLKVFPAEPLGGPSFVRALASLDLTVRFMPTGGIDRDRAAAYLALPQVVAVGGSWMATADQVAAGDWAGVEAAAAACRSVGRDPADP
jgi:2-dehydro-3-deoxyphosphogluconate aldolase/(4S)-4-hydroxy-2-oxoglutarate aldolase